MSLTNTQTSYGLVSKILHWTLAVVIITLLCSGLWMVTLDYYHDWYHRAPYYHKSFGVVVGVLMLLRYIWRAFQIRPEPLNSHRPWEVNVAHYVHLLLYVMVFSLVVSGYLISTADGRALELFNYLELPALSFNLTNQETLAGKLHQVLGYSLLVLLFFHISGALKHQVIDKDNTVGRML